jgi:UDP:flavonoid glycosyltransferase YjiC (YdhE family)
MIWPQTRFDAGAYENTTFVSTNHGTRLILDADIVITAAGYNTFGDCMYYRKPAIFLPQQADWLDDQYLRAESARSRGLADLVEDGDILGLLKSISTFCDSGLNDYRAAFRNFEPPEPGNHRIAEIIME